jgi:class 3 adenylate cyclase/pimeloyl-ACP methyl ester carboxylesterase
MDWNPETRYVAVGDADVAYQVFGDGPLDLLYFYGLGSHIEVLRESPTFGPFMLRLASFSRVILFDRRGTGASDAVSRHAIPTLEDWTEDVAAVLDAVGSERAAIIAALDAGPIAMLYAAMHPERVSALVLLNTTARYLRDDDYPFGFAISDADAIVSMLASTWGTIEFARALNPGIDDLPFLEGVALWARHAATPRTAAAQYDYILKNTDVRAALPLIQAPTRVLHVVDSPIVPLEHGRYLSEHVDGATLVTIPGGSLSMTPNLESLFDETAEFLTGERPRVEIDRVLTTVLFTDIVESTRHVATLGDRRWRARLDDHDRIVRDELTRFRGREINTTGDGFVAAFDGPARAIRCARSIVERVRPVGLEVRAGLHTGECEVRGEDLGGLAVHIAARVGSMGAPGEVVVSGTVRDLVVGSGIEFAERGEHELRGVPDTWKLFSVVQPIGLR